MRDVGRDDPLLDRELVKPPGGHQGSRDRTVGERRLARLGVTAPEFDEELPHVLLGHLVERRDVTRLEMAPVPFEITSIRRDGVRRRTPLHRQVVEVARDVGGDAHDRKPAIPRRAAGSRPVLPPRRRSCKAVGSPACGSTPRSSHRPVRPPRPRGSRRALASTISPPRTMRTASSNAIHSTSSSASSSTRSAASRWWRSSARYSRRASSVNPGDSARSTRTCQVSAARSASSASSRRAASSGLLVLVQQPGWQFEQPPADPVPVLAHHRDPAVLVAREDRHGTEVLHDLPLGDPPTGHDDIVDAQRQDRPVVDGAGARDLEVVTQPVSPCRRRTRPRRCRQPARP